tara:strand:+ start:133 stop:468 length:336 start_codon:yes stop_codon:yes gene_type:complete
MAWWTNTGQSDVHRRSAQRELLELFGLGERNHTEVDVQAAAVVLTGWTTARRQRSPRFVSRRHTGTSAHRHIGTSQTLLGATGVNDVGSVINAVINDPAHPGFVADRVISE